MELGKHLRELIRLRISVVVCLALAAFAALLVSYKISLFPPKLELRSLEIASARTEVLVDTPLSTVLDLRQGSAEIESLTSRAVLIGNVMVSPPVLAYIGRRAGVPADIIRSETPLTPLFPRPLSGPGESKKTSDLLKSTDEYRLNIQANPTVPILQIFAQAPDAKAAATLANAAVDGLRDYLAAQAKTQSTPLGNQVRVSQLGRAEGAVINGGVRGQLVILAFLIVFALSAATAMFIGRVRRGWNEFADDEDFPPAPSHLDSDSTRPQDLAVP